MHTEQRPFGFWTATALVVGGMIAAGVFILPAQMAPYGVWSIAAWLVAIAGSLLLALVFVTLVRAVAIAGLPPSKWLAVLVATAVAGRWAAMVVQSLGEPIDHDDAKRSLVAAPAPAWLVAAVSLAVATLVVLAIGKVGILALALAAIAAFALGLEASAATVRCRPRWWRRSRRSASSRSC